MSQNRRLNKQKNFKLIIKKFRNFKNKSFSMDIRTNQNLFFLYFDDKVVSHKDSASDSTLGIK